MGDSPATVLVVDDEPGVRDYLSAVLSFEGYRCRAFDGPLPALRYIQDGALPADLMLADINMPDMNGMELLRSSKAVKPEMPVILVSGLYELALALEALDSGADDYLRKPVKPRDVVALVERYLSNDSGEQEAALKQALEAYVEAHTSKAESAGPLREVFRSMGFKRYETFQHSQRVAAYCRLFGTRKNLSPEYLVRLELGALLHDIGKIGIPRNILLKPGPLNADEWAVMKTHPTIGHRLLCRFEALRDEAEIVYSHHERYDGRGYPRGLKGEQIPLGARLFSIVDAFDAITSDRAYRAGSPFGVAFAEIARMSGAQFDPELADLFCTIPVEELQAVRERFPDAPVGD